MRIVSDRGTAKAVSLARGASALIAGTLLMAFAAGTAAAQQNAIASIVNAAPDGKLVLEYASRPDACGDGERSLSVRHSRTHYRNNGLDDRCDHGPARVAFTIRDHAITDMRVTVGGDSDSGRTVSAPAMASYLLSLVPSVESRSHELVSRAVLGAVLADSSEVVAPLLTLAQDRARERETRSSALFWTGMLGDTTVIAPIVAIAKDGVEPMRLRDGAVFAISQRSDAPSLDALIALARDPNDREIRKKALFWLGQKDDPRATALISSLILR